MSTSKASLPLTPAVFYILLALSIKERHGYEIMKSVEADTKRKIKMGPGTLYGSIKRMLAAGLIAEVGDRVDTEERGKRRRYYRITDKGRRALSGELKRYSQAVSAAKRQGVLPKLAF